MKNRFKGFSIILSFTLLINLFINTYEVNASTPLLGGPTPIFPWFDWSIESLKEVGLIFDPNKVYDLPSVQDLKDAIEENDPDANVTATDQGINDYINDNITVNTTDNSITYNDNSKFVLNYIGDYIKDSLSYTYVYGNSLQQSQQYFGPNIFSIGELLNNNKNSFVQMGTYYLSNGGAVYIYNYNKGDKELYAVKISDYNDVWKRCKVYQVKNVNGIAQVSEFFPESVDEINIYRAPNGNEIINITNDYTFPLVDPYSHTYLQAYFTTQPNLSCGGNDWNPSPKTFTYGNNGMLMFNSEQGLNDYISNYGIGKYPYYNNNEVYSNWVNSTGDYTVDSNNRNNIDYSQVTNYIDNSYTENGSYPTLPDINNFITISNSPNNDNPNPDNPSGGGGSGGSATATANNEGINITVNNNHSITFGGSSLSGNTVSGNGSGESGSGGIFDFLGQIGKTIGNFVKNIGQVLADIVIGLGEVVSSLLESIPTIFGDFLGALIGWLPTELRALITLSITAMILVGLIKLFRG